MATQMKVKFNTSRKPSWRKGQRAIFVRVLAKKSTATTGPIVYFLLMMMI